MRLNCALVGGVIWGILVHIVNWPWVKNGYPKWIPGKWNQGLNPVVPWWLNFDPHPIDEIPYHFGAMVDPKPRAQHPKPTPPSPENPPARK